MITDVIKPTQPYTRTRDSLVTTEELVSYGDTNIWYSGTVDEPWKISSYTENSGSTPLYSGEQVMRDVVTQNYTKRIARGEIINNPMEQIEIVAYRGVGSYSLHRTNRYGTSPNYYYSGQHRNGTMGIGNLSIDDDTYSYPAIPYIDDECINRAITEAWSRVSLNDAEILVQIAESKKTVFGLISIFKKALRIFKHVKNIQLGRLKRDFSPAELKELYMEARYALRPLMYDAIGTVKALKGLQLESDRKTFRGFEMATASDSSSDVLLYQSGTNYQIRGNQIASRSLECRSGVLTAIEMLDVPLLQWGVTELPQSIWELIPFSFIVDWFFNIGKLIASWSPKFGFKTLASWYVVTDTTTLASTAVPELCVPLWSYNYENWYRRGGTYSKVIVRKYRVPNPERPLLPSFDMNIDWLKSLDLGIILTQFAKLWDNKALRW